MKLAIWNRARICGLAATLMLSYTAVANAQTAPPPDPIADWEKRQNIEQRLTALGDDLMGDKIDPATGSIVFSHIDVDIPGNFDLPVRIQRKRGMGATYLPNTDVDFADWELVVPKISVTTVGSGGWYSAGDRCTGTPDELFPLVTTSSTSWLNPGDYMNGIHMDAPGAGARELLFVNTKALYNQDSADAPEFPASAEYTTTDNWYFTCLTASDGGEGLLGHAPNGDQYYFDRVVIRQTQDQRFARVHSWPSHGRFQVNLMATKVEDIHGNHVDYTYDSSGKLTSILASDGRQIDVTYSGDLINSVISNPGPTGQRVWTYAYRDTTFQWPFWNINAGQLRDNKVLETVTQPDGLSWTFSLDGMFADPKPAELCPVSPFTATVTHPLGAIGSFYVKPRDFRTSATDLWKQGGDNRCPDPWGDISGGAPQTVLKKSVSFSHAISSKTINNDGQSSVWSFSYSEDSSNHLNHTTVTDPEGNQTKFEHYYNWLGGTSPTPERGSKLKRKQYFDSSSNLVRTETTEWATDGLVGWGIPASHWVKSAPKELRVLQSENVVSQDGETWTTDYQYETDKTSVNYSYGLPISLRRWSSISGSAAPRGTDTVYIHDTANWMLGLVERVYHVGTSNIPHEVTSAIYNSVGQKTSQTYFGQAWSTFTYHTSGTAKGKILRVTDALGRTKEALSWHRGTPLHIRRGVSSASETNTHRAVDDNGWVTSYTDANGELASYVHDIMGRAKKITPPGGFSDTDIAYDFNGGGAVQTITRGTASTTVTYDFMLRTKQVHQQDSVSGWQSYVVSDYDGLGRTIFTARPSTSPGSIIGTNTVYDALGRIERNEDTTDPLTLFTAYSYLSSNRTRVDRSDDRYAITWRDGYSGPGKGEALQIEEYGEDANNVSRLHRTTHLDRNDFNSLTWLRQVDHTGSTPKEISQHFLYDAQQRVCAHYVPEHGETRYTYDAAGQLVTYAKGLNRTAYSGTTSCAGTGSNSSLVTLGYDALGRVLTKDFADPATLDIENVYDPNGNLTRSLRRPLGGATVNEFLRTYDVLNNILTEQQIVVGAPTSMTLTYTYDANGFMKSRHYPSNMLHTWTNDGFGQQQDLLHGGASYASNILYHPDGSLKSYEAGNGQDFTRVIDDLQRTERLHSISGAYKPLDLIYTYNSTSQISSIYDAGNAGANAAGKTHSVSNLQYDALGHMTHADGWWGTGTFAYDGFGNLGKRWLSETGANPRRIWNFYDANNRVFVTDDSLPTTSGGASWHSHSYDDRGNMTRSGSSLNNAHTMFMTYDMSDQMVGMSGHNLKEDALTASYQYNGLGKRVYTNMNGRQSYPMYDAGGALREVYKVHDGERVNHISLQNGHPLAKWTGSTLTYLHADHLGTPIRGTHGSGGTSGLTVGDESFQDFSTPYGLNPTSGWWGNGGSGFDPATGQGSNCGVTGFTTHAKDCESGLQYMQARMYDPVRAGFTSIDPVDFMTDGRPGMVNRYGYTLGDPINMYDPDGNAAACLAPPLWTPCAKGAVFVLEAIVVGGVLLWELTNDIGEDQNGDDSDDGPFDQDKDGKIHDIDDVDIESLTEEELLAGERQLEEDKERRQIEQDSYPRGSRNGTREEREDYIEHKKHKDRMKKHDKVRDRVRERLPPQEE